MLRPSSEVHRAHCTLAHQCGWSQYGQFLYPGVIYLTSPRFFEIPDPWAADRTFSLGGTVKNLRWCWQIRQSLDKQIAWWWPWPYKLAGNIFVISEAKMTVDLENCFNRRKSVSLELTFAHYVSHFPFILPLSHSLLSPPPLFFLFLAPSSLFFICLLSYSSPHSPSIFLVSEEGGRAGMGSGLCFSNCRSWHISGSRNQFSGSWNQFKGSWPEFFFKWNRIKSNRTVSIKHSKDKYYLWNYICAYVCALGCNVKHLLPWVMVKGKAIGLGLASYMYRQ